MPTDSDSPLIAAIARAAQPLTGAANDHDALLGLVGDARFVLLGEATHGTHEFYHERARITRRLIAEHGFNAVAVEADWPDAYRVNRHVRGLGQDACGTEALGGFQRFPGWMWRNTEVLAFVDWLRAFNRSAAPSGMAGFYGLDLYSLFSSIGEVLHYLDKVDPRAARRARRRYACFDHFGTNSQRYAYAAGFGLSDSCEKAVLSQLLDLQARAADYQGQDAPQASDDFFHARQNARLVIDAEAYYRTMFRGRVSSWNLRDQHMMETLEALEALDQHLSAAQGKPARIVVWAHNSHIGDARATEVGRQGEWTLGQLARQRYGDDTRLIGFTTCKGTVTAASDWDGHAERKRVRPALPGSYEHAIHQSGIGRFMLPLAQGGAAARALAKPRLERAIGVIYLPQCERRSHYFYPSLPRQFDAVLHIDETRAVQALEPTGHWESGETPETYPVGV